MQSAQDVQPSQLPRSAVLGELGWGQGGGGVTRMNEWTGQIELTVRALAPHAEPRLPSLLCGCALPWLLTARQSSSLQAANLLASFQAASFQADASRSDGDAAIDTSARNWPRSPALADEVRLSAHLGRRLCRDRHRRRLSIVLCRMQPTMQPGEARWAAIVHSTVDAAEEEAVAAGAVRSGLMAAAIPASPITTADTRRAGAWVGAWAGRGEEETEELAVHEVALREAAAEEAEEDRQLRELESLLATAEVPWSPEKGDAPRDGLGAPSTLSPSRSVADRQPDWPLLTGWQGLAGDRQAGE